MKVVFTDSDVSLDWQALAKVIRVIPTLPNDLTLEVSKKGTRVLNASGAAIETPIPERYTKDENVRSVTGKTALLAALDERFGIQRPPVEWDSPSVIARPSAS